MTGNVNNPSFYQEVVKATPQGELLLTCLQCGTCGGSCPSGPDMDHTPRKIIALLREGMAEEVLDSNTPWMCVSCYYCVARCPQQIPITDLMYTLKQMAVAQGKFNTHGAHTDFSNSFVGYVERYGRSFEFGLSTRYHLTHHPLKMAGMGGLGFKMLQKGRLAPRPESIRGKAQLKAILAEAKRLATQQEV